MRLTDLYPMKLSILFAILMFTIFLFKGDKKKFPLFLPTCLLAGIFDLWTDILTSEFPSLWHYADTTALVRVTRHLIHPFFAYFYTVYLFLQWIPIKNNSRNIVFYMTGWVVFAILVEATFVHFGELKYGIHWSAFRSVIVDYLLLIIFYFHHVWHKRKITNYFQKKNQS